MEHVCLVQWSAHVRDHPTSRAEPVWIRIFAPSAPQEASESSVQPRFTFRDRNPSSEPGLSHTAPSTSLPAAFCVAFACSPHVRVCRSARSVRCLFCLFACLSKSNAPLTHLSTSALERTHTRPSSSTHLDKKDLRVVRLSCPARLSAIF